MNFSGLWDGAAAAFDATVAVDILALSVLLYFALVGLQRVRTAHALRGALLLGAVYLIARQFNLELTSGALEAFLVMLLVALIMIYREELRQLVERVSRLAVRRSPTSGVRGVGRIVAETAFELADKRCGALIVFTGESPIAMHLTGGVSLGGEVSTQLLDSIFDASSSGHDGALVIVDGIVTRFGAHLPLSKNLEAIGKRGTRHAAALGLTEVSDALCLIVSEERGQVSLAQHGALLPVEDVGHLENAIHEHIGHTEEAAPRWGLLTQHHGLKLVALGVASVAWLVLVHGGEQLQKSIATRIALRSDTEGRLIDISPPEVRLIVTGSRRDLALAPRSPIRVRLTPPEERAGEQRVRVAAEDIVLPRGLTLKSVVPAEVKVTLRPSSSAAGSASAAPSSSRK